MGLKVLACGGRDYEDRKHVEAALAKLHARDGIDLLIHGGARGADTLAGAWAEEAKIPVCVFPANWTHQRTAAGPLRNISMLRFGQPDAVVAFPGGRGTADMVRRAKDAGVKVWEPSPSRSNGTER